MTSPHVVRLVHVDRDDTGELGRIGRGRLDGQHLPGGLEGRAQGGDDVSDDLEGVLVVLGEVVDHAGPAGVEFSSPELLRADHLADRRFHAGADRRGRSCPGRAR